MDRTWTWLSFPWHAGNKYTDSDRTYRRGYSSKVKCGNTDDLRILLCLTVLGRCAMSATKIAPRPPTPATPPHPGRPPGPRPPFSWLRPPFSWLRPPFSWLRPAFSWLRPPFSWLRPPFSWLRPPFSWLRPPFSWLLFKMDQHCSENPIYFSFSRNARPQSQYPHVSVSDLYIPGIGPHISPPAAE